MPQLGPLACYVLDGKGNAAWFHPGDDVPAWAAKQMGSHCFANGEDDDVEDTGDGPPPRAGVGSGRDAWADYAQANGVEVEVDWKRDHIIAACEEAGVPVE